MTKVLVLYYSMYGHVDTLAKAVAEGARKVEGVEVTVKRVPETMPADAFKNAGGKQDYDTPEATPRNWPITMRLLLVPQPALAI